MLTKMEVYGGRTSLPELLLSMPGSANSDPIQIKDIQGLDPVKGNVNTSPFGSADGESYFGTSIGKRNIVLSFGLNPDWATHTVSSLRQMLYAYFMPKNEVTLRFFSEDLPTVEISGYCESIEPNIFSKAPEVQISIICPMPYFNAVTSTVVNGVVNDGSSYVEIDYPGSVETGFVLEIESSVAKPSYTGAFAIVNNTPFVSAFPFSATVDANQSLVMSSIQGEKYLRSINLPTGAATNIMAAIAADAIWPVLQPGINRVGVIADQEGQTWSLTYLSKFGGL